MYITFTGLLFFNKLNLLLLSAFLPLQLIFGLVLVINDLSSRAVLPPLALSSATVSKVRIEGVSARVHRCILAVKVLIAFAAHLPKQPQVERIIFLLSLPDQRRHPQATRGPLGQVLLRDRLCDRLGLPFAKRVFVVFFLLVIELVAILHHIIRNLVFTAFTVPILVVWLTLVLLLGLQVLLVALRLLLVLLGLVCHARGAVRCEATHYIMHK